MNSDMKLYYDYAISPLGKLFYTTLWSQLSDITGKNVLDFGSGFAFTTNFLAQKNHVTAVEQLQSMIEHSDKRESFTQINAGIEYLASVPDESFDVVLCHLVFEFAQNREEIMRELVRVLKKGGTMSIVRHNKNGRIIQAVVQDYDLDDAVKLLEGGNSFSSAFGDIVYHTDEDILKLAEDKLKISETFGIRTLASLHGSELQQGDKWIEDMFNLESMLVNQPEFKSIAYFNHLILHKC